MIGKEQSARPYPQIGVPEAHHPLSHHNDIPELIAQMSKINRYHTQLFSQYLAKLRATPDGDGSLLDHMTILYGSGISNSHAPLGRQPAAALMGGGSGTLKGGRHLKYADKPIDGEPAGDVDGQDGRAGRDESAAAPASCRSIRCQESEMSTAKTRRHEGAQSCSDSVFVCFVRFVVDVLTSGSRALLIALMAGAGGRRRSWTRPRTATGTRCAR